MAAWVLSLPDGRSWLPLAAGGTAALAVLTVGGLVLRRRRPVPPAESASQFLTISRPELRHAQRRRGNAVEVLISDADARARPSAGSVIDRYASGMRLAVEGPVAEATVLSVRPAQFAAIVPWVQVTVTNCRQVDAGWEIGCRFVEQQPLSVLLLFG